MFERFHLIRNLHFAIAAAHEAVFYKSCLHAKLKRFPRAPLNIVVAGDHVREVIILDLLTRLPRIFLHLILFYSLRKKLSHYELVAAPVI